MDFAGLGAERAVPHRAPLHLGNFGGHADDDSRPQPTAAPVRLSDEMRQHFLGGFEVGDDAILHRLDGRDVARRSSEHLLGVGADRFDAAVDLVQGDDRRLADDNALAAGVYAGVGGAEIDGQIVGKTGEQCRHHVRPSRATWMPSLTVWNPPETIENSEIGPAELAAVLHFRMSMTLLS